MGAKPVWSKPNRASADRCLRALGALIAIAPSDVKRADGWDERRIVAWIFTKRQTGDLDEYWLLDPSGNCCEKFYRFAISLGGTSAPIFAQVCVDVRSKICQ